MIEIHYDHASSISFVSIKKKNKEFFQKLIREILISGYISYLIHFISFHFFFSCEWIHMSLDVFFFLNEKH